MTLEICALYPPAWCRNICKMGNGRKKTGRQAASTYDLFIRYLAEEHKVIDAPQVAQRHMDGFFQFLRGLHKNYGKRGLLDYLLSAEDQKGETRPRVKIIASTFAGRTARAIAREFSVLRALRPRLEVAVVHETLRLPPTASEPSDALWRAIAKYWTSKMGFDSWIAVAHGDDHVHIAASRILLDGSVVSDSNDWTLSERVVRDIEAEFGLEGIRPSHLLDPSRDWVQQKAVTRQQLAVAERSGVALPSDIVASAIDFVISKGGTVSDLIAALEGAGGDVRPNVATTWRVAGLAYRVGDITVTAKAFGRSYTWANLIKAGLQYDQSRDLPVLLAAAERSRANAPDTKPGLTAAGALKVSDPNAGTATLMFETAARFVEVMECDRFTVTLQRAGKSGAMSATAEDLRNPENLKGLLGQNRDGANVGIAPVDRRIVMITGLGAGEIELLSEFGFQPSAVVESKAGAFEAAIRLLPATAPEPSPELHRAASKILADAVSGRVAEWLRLPGFINRSPDAIRNKRRPLVYLRRATAVVAELGARFLHWVEQVFAPENSETEAKTKPAASLSALSSQIVLETDVWGLDHAVPVAQDEVSAENNLAVQPTDSQNRGLSVALEGLEDHVMEMEESDESQSLDWS